MHFATFLRLFLAVEIMCFRHIPMVIGVNLAVYACMVGSCTRHAKYHKEKFVVSSRTSPPTHTIIPSKTCAITTKFNSDIFTIRILQLEGLNCKLQLLNYIYFNTLWFPRCPLDMAQGIHIRPQLFYQI